MKRALPFVLIALVLGAGLLMFRSLQGPTPESPAPARPSSVPPSQSPARAPTQAEAGAQPPHALGNANAPVTLEEFGDFQCPPCAMLHPILKNLEAEFGPAKLRIIFREFPL